MKTFLAIYRGGTVASAELVAVSADPEIVAEVTERLLGEDSALEDPVSESLAHGRRSALEVIHREAVDGVRRTDRFSVVPFAADQRNGQEHDAEEETLPQRDSPTDMKRGRTPREGT